MNTKQISLITAACLASGSMAFAAAVTPEGTFGAGPAGATYSGTGNPNNAVETTTINSGNTTITLGLAAQQRYYNPLVGNDGAGTFFATTGANQGDPNGPGPSIYTGSTWNFDYYVGVSGGFLSGDSFKLLYDFDPGVGTDRSQLGILDLNNLFIAGGGDPLTSGITQDSENLNFSFLSLNLPGLVSPPSGSFDPNAAGEYSFVLEAFDANNTELGEVAINVNVASVPDVGGVTTNVVAGAGLLLFGWVLKRKSVTA